MTKKLYTDSSGWIQVSQQGSHRKNKQIIQDLENQDRFYRLMGGSTHNGKYLRMGMWILPEDLEHFRELGWSLDTHYQKLLKENQEDQERRLTESKRHYNCQITRVAGDGEHQPPYEESLGALGWLSSYSVMGLPCINWVTQIWTKPYEIQDYYFSHTGAAISFVVHPPGYKHPWAIATETWNDHQEAIKLPETWDGKPTIVLLDWWTRVGEFRKVPVQRWNWFTKTWEIVE